MKSTWNETLRTARSGPFMIVVAFCSLVIVTGRACGAEIFVSPGGDDANVGTQSQPLRTLEAVQDKARQLDHDQSITVWLRAGVYERSELLRLTKADSGTPDHPMAYRAWPNEEVRIVGGRVINGWEAVTDDAILSRLVPEARNHVIQVDLKKLGLTDYGPVKGGGLELFFDDRPMTLARWPNEGFVKITGLVEPDTVNVRGTKGSKTGQFMYEGDRPNRWLKENDAWVHGYWFWDWSDARQKIESIDTDKHIISVVPPYHHYGYRVGQWFYAMNILAELDSPEEWYLDRQSSILYFWPPRPVDKGRAIVSISKGLLDLSDVSHVTFEGLTFEACRGTAVVLSNCQQCCINSCILRNLGDAAIHVAGGKGNRVESCDIYQTGRGCISLSGGDRATLSPGGHVAENNHIHDYGRWDRMYTPAISLAGVGNRASHNLIHDAPHMAIGFGGNNHTIEFNEIHHVCLESNDAGAIYAGRDWTMRGTIIRHNYLHHINGFEGKGCVGVYLDDMFCGTQIYGNLFYQVTRAAFIGGGRDCTVENNIFVDCQRALHIDARAMNWASASVETTMTDRLKAMPYTSELWRQSYPKLVNILADEPAAPKGNVVARNLFIGGRWNDVYKEAKPYVTFTSNHIDRDGDHLNTLPELTGLQTEAVANIPGFELIPVEQIGLSQWPFDAQTAHLRQKETAKAIGQPVELTDSIGMKLRLIPTGEFMMGSPEDEEGHAKDEGPVHRVRLTKPFYLGVYEVTIEQFRQFVEATGHITDAEKDARGGWGYTGNDQRPFKKDPKYTWQHTGFTQGDNYPVVNVSWNDAMAFCRWLSQKESTTYRLPTEAEWEYACRAGTQTRFYHGDDPNGLAEVGNVSDATANTKFAEWMKISEVDRLKIGTATHNDGYAFTAPVGCFRANAFGLYDMIGNVWEWCSDWDKTDYYRDSPTDDPTGPADGSMRIRRGGSWLHSPEFGRSARRRRYAPDARNSPIGFRIVMVPAE